MSHLLLLLAVVAVSSPAFAADEIRRTMTGTGSVTVHWRGAGPTLSYGLTSAYGLIAADGPSFVLVVGDLAYANPNGQEAADNHFNNVIEVVAGCSLHAGLGATMSGKSTRMTT